MSAALRFFSFVQVTTYSGQPIALHWMAVQKLNFSSSLSPSRPGMLVSLSHRSPQRGSRAKRLRRSKMRQSISWLSHLNRSQHINGTFLEPPLGLGGDDRHHNRPSPYYPTLPSHAQCRVEISHFLSQHHGPMARDPNPAANPGRPGPIAAMAGDGVAIKEHPAGDRG